MVEPVIGIAVRVGIIALVLTGVFLGRYLLHRWQAVRRERVLRSEALPGMSNGEASVLLFTGTLCSDCLVQKDILKQLKVSSVPFHVREVMAAKEVALAGRFGVQSVPATVVLNREGKPVGVNYGLVSGDIIASQLHGANGGSHG
jgi:F plasmid transfer operon protein